MGKIIDNRMQMGRMLDDAVTMKTAANAIVQELDYRSGKTVASGDYIMEKLEKIQRCVDFLKSQVVTHEE